MSFFWKNNKIWLLLGLCLGFGCTETQKLEAWATYLPAETELAALRYLFIMDETDLGCQSCLNDFVAWNDALVAQGLAIPSVLIVMRPSHFFQDASESRINRWRTQWNIPYALHVDTHDLYGHLGLAKSTVVRFRANGTVVGMEILPTGADVRKTWLAQSL